jgi:hypothetical protein
MSEVSEHLVRLDSNIPIIKSSCENINSLLKIGGYPTRTLIGIFGPSGSAKSILCWQEAFFFLKQSQKNVLYFGTEGGEEMYPQLWFSRWKERFALKSEDLQRVYVLSMRDIQKILELHGYIVRIKREYSGKLDVLTTGLNLKKYEKEGKFKGAYLSPIEEFVVNNNVGMIIVDSISNPIDLEFSGGGYLDFPARAGITSKWLNVLQRIASRMDVLILTVYHHSVRPGSEPDLSTLKDVPKIKGGEITEYNLKIILYLHNSPLSSLEDISALSELRRMYLVRFFDEAKWAASASLMINDTGIYDISKDEIDILRKQAEAAKHRRKLMK